VLGFEPMTFESESECATQYTTAPLEDNKASHDTYVLFLCLTFILSSWQIYCKYLYTAVCFVVLASSIIRRTHGVTIQHDRSETRHQCQYVDVVNSFEA